MVCIYFWKHTTVPILLIRMDNTLKLNLQQALNKSVTSLIIMENFGTSTTLHDIFDGISTNNLVKNSWLIVISSYNDKPKIIQMIREKLDL